MICLLYCVGTPAIEYFTDFLEFLILTATQEAFAKQICLGTV